MVSRNENGSAAFPRKIVVIGFGSPAETETHQNEKGIYGAFLKVFSCLFSGEEPPGMVLVGPEGVKATRGVKSVCERQSSMYAVQSLCLQNRGEDLNVYCYELTKGTPSLLPWRSGFAKTLVLDHKDAIAQVMKPIVDASKVNDANISMHWENVMAVRLAHGEGVGKS